MPSLHDTPPAEHTPRAALSARLCQLLHQLEQVLPAQAPIRDFVHHNTLHGFQHLPFQEALAQVQALTGQSAWLPEARCLEALATGRMTDIDLKAAFASVLPEAVRHATPLPDSFAALELDHDRIALAALRVSQVVRDGLPTRRWRWEHDENHGPDSLSQQADLWQACLAVCPADEMIASNPASPDWSVLGQQCWQQLQARFGPAWTLRRLLRHLTGIDVQQVILPVLIRHLAAHLDRGVAAWHNPEQATGFYSAWRHSAGADPAWDMEELPNARHTIDALPDNALDALLAELPQLGLDEAGEDAYLQRLMLELPGWSGMFLWHHEHAEAAAQTGTTPPDLMVDYLAVRLILERLHTSDLCQHQWLLEPDLAALGHYFAEHPAELWLRDQSNSTEDWPDALRHRVQQLKLRHLDHQGEQDHAAWQTLAGEVWSALAQAAPTLQQARHAAKTVFPLFRLCQTLDLSAAQAEALAPAGAAALLAAARAPWLIDDTTRGLVWLTAYEHHYQTEIFAAVLANHGRADHLTALPEAQVVFCMDDREEGSRRHLEEVNPRIVTLGAAGFFGLPLYWCNLDGSRREALCPVVVKPTSEVRETPLPGQEGQAGNHLRRRQWRRRWREALQQESRRGLLLGPLLTSLTAPLALGTLLVGSLAPARWASWMRQSATRFDMPVRTRLQVSAAPESVPGTPEAPRAGFDTAEQVSRVAAFLRTLGLTQDFAPLVTIMGHGSGSRNNPHLSAYDCGACSGRHGGPNARAFALIANRPEVRAGLLTEGIAIPDSCWFLAAEHNTCDDAVRWYDLDLIPASHQAATRKLQGEVETAMRRHAVERCRRLASAPLGLTPEQAIRHVAHRRHDASQARPELGHATNATALVGRRNLSRGAFFDRRAFLISYDPGTDADGSILENLLLAVGPVGAGISLEYYFSTVNNAHFGCGSKITHNVSGFVGVMEGASSDLRTGLPQQMIEIHEAMRLLLVVEQHPDILTALYLRQPPIQELVGKGWLHLAAKVPDQPELWRFYPPDSPLSGWQRWQPETAPDLPTCAESLDWCRDSRNAGQARDPLPPALLTRPLEVV